MGHSRDSESRPIPHVWRAFAEIFNDLSLSHDFSLRSFVLMGNHYHALAEYSGDLDLIERDLHRGVVGLTDMKTEYLVLKPIDNFRQYYETYKYIYRNPVEGGLCSLVQDYDFSTLHSLLGKSRCPFRFVDNMDVVQHPVKRLAWLNNEESLYG